MAVSGSGLALVSGGFVLFWSGFRNVTLQATLKAFLRGQLPASNPTGAPTLGVSTAPTSASSPSAFTAPAGDTGAATATAAANQALARALVVATGHPSWATGAQWQALLSLWNQESGWSNTADTRKSGLDPPDATTFAYGIPQARPYSKMPQAAWPPDKGGFADPVTQITWGIGYIAAAYGSPAAAWTHEGSAGSY